MLKGKLLIALASAVLFLGACSNETPQEQEQPQTTQSESPSETTEGYTGALTYERLYDPTGAKPMLFQSSWNLKTENLHQLISTY